MWQKEEGLPLVLAVARISGVAVAEDDRGYHSLCDCAAHFKQRYAGRTISEVPGVEWSRKLFHAMNQDPTKRRPSSEALLNRALKDKPLYNINSLVDIGNWCSLDFLLPICVYDADAIQGQVEARIGRPGENYLGHNDQIMNMEGRFILADKAGAFGSPISDSQRTAVTTATRNAWLVIFAPAEYSEPKLQEQLAVFMQRVLQCGGGGQAEEQFIL
jgi:DNA/RNA-binding domain of Phe-tRNA-synthetase-like protein